MAEPVKKPDPVDTYVGSRMRLRRTMMSMSQEKLGDTLGITFQQIQKYEKGTNRIGASRLFKIATALRVDIGFFFEGMPIVGAAPVSGMSEAGSASYVVDSLASTEGLQLNRAFARITNPAIRRKVAEMVKTLAEETGEPEDSRD